MKALRSAQCRSESAAHTPTLVFDRGSVRRENGELVGNITDCSVAFARQMLIRHNAHDELVAALRDLEYASRFVQKPLRNMVDAQWKARAVLASVEAIKGDSDA